MYWHGPTCDVLVDTAMNVHIVHRCPSRTIAWLLVTGSARGVTARVVAVAYHCKANTTLTKLYLHENNVGDAGAVALADALKARVFVVLGMRVQGVCLLLPQMSLYKVVSRVCVFELLCSVRSGFCNFACGLEENVHSGLWRGWRARFVLHLMWHSV